MAVGIPSTSTATMRLEASKPSAPALMFDPTTGYLPTLGADVTDESETASSSSSSGEHPACAVTSTQLRALLASSMSAMYRTEVPLYGDLLSIISTVNSDVIRRLPSETTLSDDEISRLNVERHGAIRVGTAAELALLARIFRVFGMHAVGYYDLHTDAGLPIHATAFRPVGAENLIKNPFRIFCSLLRMDLVRDASTRALAEELLAKRQIVSDRCVELLVKVESAQGMDGLTRAEALEFVERVVDIFAWHKDTPVSLAQYQLLAKSHPLVADIVSFRGPHINHLTPRTLDIDQVQSAMIEHGIDAKEIIEGPPARKMDVYLRQTSFHALSESVEFRGEGGVVEGKHKARFGEIEARGQALTRKGARLYDKMMAEVARRKREREGERTERVGQEECVRILQEVFEAGFPDTKDAILREGLGYFMFSVKDADSAKDMMRGRKVEEGCELLADLVDAGALEAEPITYEDFLPASAAGIFQSNLPSTSDPSRDSTAESAPPKMDPVEARRTLEAAVGGTILDYFTLYSEQQSQSLVEVGAVIGISVDALIEMTTRQGA
ncbi:hypothetical protein EX895_001106 [Sporisorium graminicola]|uniref:2-oxoadipate dioxygenase/decarboxylase n=1 Tax=Sporisorium graminicola TaxID=280036 RepID=A0A4V6EW14_9BASI|nr:hypothetical protein EX895_001106 [Sporisorium graminicola]TKY89809.1 hypothetical protein EX895_001106 [Sporisorium graminicola]